MFSNLLKLNKDLQKSAPTKDSPYYVGIVIIDRDREKIMLGKRTEDGIWTGPGGSAEHNEHPKQAAIREIFEESALKITPRELKELPSLVVGNGKVCHCFMVNLDSKKVKPHAGNDPDKEVKKWEWYSLKDPLPGKTDTNRLTTINNAKMKIYGLKKSIIENPEAGIDLNTAEQSLDEMASKDNNWIDIINAIVANAEYGEEPKELLLPDLRKLMVSKVDDGFFSGYVVNNDPQNGSYGEVLVQLSKMTPESMVQALKAKGYLPKAEMNLPEKPDSSDYNSLYSALSNFKGDLHIHLEKSLIDLNTALKTSPTPIDEFADLNTALRNTSNLI